MQGFRLASDIKLTFNREAVLEKLRVNLEVHKTIMVEAKAGYLVKVKAALEAKLEQVNAGHMVSLSFGLSRPVSHIETYEAMISMLEAADDETLELSIEQQQAFMEDRWDWQQGFLESSKGYSATASRMSGD